jgi:hypothetical protein
MFESIATVYSPRVFGKMSSMCRTIDSMRPDGFSVAVYDLETALQ